jgi:hypothetical protein
LKTQKTNDETHIINISQSKINMLIIRGHPSLKKNILGSSIYEFLKHDSAGEFNEIKQG